MNATDKKIKGYLDRAYKILQTGGYNWMTKDIFEVAKMIQLEEMRGK